MADYKYKDFDTYGYSEEIQFTPLSVQCKVEYGSTDVVEPKLTEVESFISQSYPEQNKIALPKCKCLRK